MYAVCYALAHESIVGFSGNEAVLLMRLHLLQAIVAFHLNKVNLSQELLRKAESELRSLKVNPDDIVQIVALGKFRKKKNPYMKLPNTLSMSD